MLKIFKYLKPFIPHILVIIVALYIQVMYCDLALPDYMSKIINNGVIAKDSAYVLKTGGIMLLVALLGLVMTILVSYLASKIGSGFSKKLRNVVFSKVINYEASEYKNVGMSSLITRTTNDISQIQMFIVIGFRILIMAPLMAYGGIVKILASSSSMVYIVVIGVVCLFILIGTLLVLTTKKFNFVQKYIDNVNLVTRESLIGVMPVRAFNNEKKEEKRFKEANDKMTGNNLFIDRVMSLMNPMMMLIINFIIIFIIWQGSKLINVSELEIGEMMAYVQYAMQIMMAFLMTSMMFIFMPRAIAASKRIKELLDSKSDVLDSKNPVSLDNITGEITFNNVSFAFPDSEEHILKNLNITFPAKKTTSIIGSTGSGKSTITSLIPRFYDVTEGEILIDGINIKDVSKKELRNNVSYVLQKATLVNKTIESNIKYGNELASFKEISLAANLSAASDFIEAKNDSYQTMIAQGATNLSGGEKQRVSIARGLIKNAKIFIFDDSFSALDYKTDKKVRTNLAKNAKDKTVIIVTQRISSAMDADQIVVLDEGKVVGIGNHDDLLATCQTYNEIALSQLSKEELDEKRGDKHEA